MFGSICARIVTISVVISESRTLSEYWIWWVSDLVVARGPLKYGYSTPLMGSVQFTLAIWLVNASMPFFRAAAASSERQDAEILGGDLVRNGERDRRTSGSALPEC